MSEKPGQGNQFDTEFRVSSLHDDPLTPFDDRALPEYDPVKGYPNRLEDLGEKGEYSVIHRLNQFGITQEDLSTAGVDSLMDITEVQYGDLMQEAVRRQYDILFPSVFTHWSDIEGAEKQFDFIRETARRYNDWGLKIVGKGEALGEEGPSLVISLEGAEFIQSREDVARLYDTGVRSVMIQYNADNALATREGLTLLGEQVVLDMMKKGIIIDLAHVQPSPRTAILDMADEYGFGSQVAYTHGSTAEDMAQDPMISASGAESRGLSQAEMKRVIDLGGIIGLGATRPFFQSIDHIAQRMMEILQIERGPKSLGVGTDFGGVAPMWKVGIDTPADLARLANVLSDRFNVPDATIRNILRNNAREWLANKS